jgi:hypothetical protein
MGNDFRQQQEKERVVRTIETLRRVESGSIKDQLKTKLLKESEATQA